MLHVMCLTLHHFVWYSPFRLSVPTFRVSVLDLACREGMHACRHQPTQVVRAGLCKQQKPARLLAPPSPRGTPTQSSICSVCAGFQV